MISTLPGWEAYRLVLQQAGMLYRALGRLGADRAHTHLLHEPLRPAPRCLELTAYPSHTCIRAASGGRYLRCAWRACDSIPQKSACAALDLVVGEPGDLQLLELPDHVDISVS